MENADYTDLNPNGDLIGVFELCFNYDSPAVVQFYGLDDEPIFVNIEVITPEQLDAEIIDIGFPSGSSICLGQSLNLQAFASGADYYSWVIDNGPTLTGVSDLCL